MQFDFSGIFFNVGKKKYNYAHEKYNFNEEIIYQVT